MLRGLDLFSGIGGLTIAMRGWSRPLAYCENERYAQGVLLSRMGRGDLPRAPIWDDVRTLRGNQLPPLDIIYGGFPCQDLSVAGRGKGLAGERSGLFFEVLRLAEEIGPALVFLENVPGIRRRGADVVVEEFSSRGYDCRWTNVSAAEVGAPHLRRRWFLLAANSKRLALRNLEQRGPDGRARPIPAEGEAEPLDDGCEKSLADPDRIRREIEREAHDDLRKIESRDEPDGRGTDVGDARGEGREVGVHGQEGSKAGPSFTGAGWWLAESDVDRVADGVPRRVDRIRSLGNSVVPPQARFAFEKLLGVDG